MSVDLKEISLNGVGLQPLEGETTEAPTGKAKFTPNTRDKKSDRRQKEDRRVDFRPTENRRTAKDRRPVKTWENGKNL